MKKIVLLCANGMSTSLLVKKMKEYATSINYECSIEAHPISEIDKYAPDANIILLGPQVRFKLKEMTKNYPNNLISVIVMRDYGMVNGQAVLENAKEKMGED